MDPTFIAAASGPWPLHDAAATRAAEAAAAAQALMPRAGLAAARLALALWPHTRRIDVLAGPGNNGGDGAVAALHLHLAGKSVCLRRVAHGSVLPADAADAWQRAHAAGVPMDAVPADAPPDLVIDALLGIGASRAPIGALGAAIDALNAGRAPVLALDLPSGLHPDTGMPLGDCVVRATATLSLLTLKPGLFTGQGRDLAGAVWLDRLGVAATGATATLGGPPRTAPRQHAQHKGSFGDVIVVGGAAGMTGAAWLAAHAALAAGAGRVYCSLLDDAVPLLDPARPELMGRSRAWQAPPAALAVATVVCGCGGGAPVRDALPPLLAHAGRLVLDADALNAIAADPALQSLLRLRRQPTVLTPHPLEAARLLRCATREVQRDRLAAARALAERYAAVVVLKGSGSVVAAAGALPCVNPTGNARLATPGTGDVLAGWIGALLAQGLPGHAAAQAAVWQHGAAADRAAAGAVNAPLLAADLVRSMADGPSPGTGAGACGADA